MGSKREEERNEKVIRGLMKLPPNRRCINCNNLGPGYVCTNFWTFVCITCSGIHREFTHRVKSVSMAKFTSQEVEALQKGGNQRARETYLVHWDLQKQKQPNSSHVEKVREFIKHVYVDKKYAAGKTSDKPPTGTQNLRHPEDETRRASSYHSYSQSPPYDTQYEERRYGRQLPVLTRKPGSDRGLYEGKVSNFSSPSRFSDQTLEPPRASDYSTTSPGFSPNFQSDGRVKSPNYQTNDNITKENPERVRRTQRATSSGSFGSFDSNNSLSFKSNNSVTLADLVSAPDEIIQNKQNTISSLPESSSISTTFGGLDLFETPFAPNNVIPSLEAQPKAPIDLFEPSSISSVPNVYAQKPLETTPPSLDFFSQMPPQQPPSVTMGKTSPAEVVPKNEGWAMFDFPQQGPPTEPMSIHNTAQEPVSMDNIAHEPMSTHNIAHEPSIHNIWHGEPYESQVSFTNTHVVEGKNAHEPSIHNIWHGEPYESQVSFTNTHVVERKNAHESTPVPSIAHEPAVIHNIAHDPVSMHNLWNGEPYKSRASFTNTQVNEGNNAHEPTSKPNLWHGEQYKSQVPFTNNQQSWDAFEDPTKQLSCSATHQSGQEVAYQTPFTNVDQYLGDFNQTGVQRAVFENRPPITNIPSHVEARQHVIERKSSNPFELSDDCEFESGSMYLDMNSLQAELPTSQLQNAFVDDVNQSWFVHNPAPHHIPPAQQGALGYMGRPPPGIQMTNVPTQEPVASVGGNPFA